MLYLCSHDKSVEYNNLIYSINEKEKTAKVIKCKSGINEIIIPRSIFYESKEFIIISILEGSFNNTKVKSIQFASDSALQMIDRSSFSYSHIESITIPSKVVELKDGWCDSTSKLVNIKVDPNNPRYRCIDGKYIIGKSKIDQENYDCLIFCVRDIKIVNVPNYIKYIYPYALDRCGKIQEFNIPNDSQLYSIRSNAFSFSSIKSITFPSQLVELEEEWCAGALKLKNIVVSPNNPILCCLDREMILKKSKNDLTSYDCLLFCVRNVKKVIIPNFIKRICSHAFSGCQKIEDIKISDDSKLEIIEREAFSYTTIRSIKIPSEVKIIGEKAFFSCELLRHVEISDDSKLKMIENDAFVFTSIESITIPSNLVILKNGWCNSTSKLTFIKVSQNNPRYCCIDDKYIFGKTDIQQSYYDCIVFCVRNIKNVMIPNYIKHICSYAFDTCQRIQSVEFESNSKLQSLCVYSFSDSSIYKFEIPSEVTFIGDGAFRYCEKLEIVEIKDDSKLQIINPYSFSNSSITSIAITSKVTRICEYAFYHCDKLQIMEIKADFKLDPIDKRSFDCIDIIILVPAHSNNFVIF